jgi:hypothetical protein
LTLNAKSKRLARNAIERSKIVFAKNTSRTRLARKNADYAKSKTEKPARGISLVERLSREIISCMGLTAQSVKVEVEENGAAIVTSLAEAPHLQSHQALFSLERNSGNRNVPQN